MRLLLGWCGIAAAAADAGGRGWSGGSAALPGTARSRGCPRAAAARTGRAAAVLRRAVRARNAVPRGGRLLARDRLRAGLLRGLVVGGRFDRRGLCLLGADGLLTGPRRERLPVDDGLLLLLRLLGVDP